jgi:hypothetical protein
LIRCVSPAGEPGPKSDITLFRENRDNFDPKQKFKGDLGYKGEELKQYCEISHPNHNFTFVNIDKIEGEGSGPGYSSLQCKSHLQRPFYFVTADCIVDSKIPHLDGNWLGVYPTAYPEKYSTIKKIRDVLNNYLLTN